MTHPTMRELYASGDYARAVLHDLFGPELPAKVAQLEGEMTRLLEDELPDADAEGRRAWAHRLAFVVALDPWFAKVGRGVTPGRVAGALNRVARAARDLQKALHAMPEAAAYSMHRRLLHLDLPGAADRIFLAESVLGTLGARDVGLHANRAALAKLLKVADDAREAWRQTKSGKHCADRLARHVADAYEALTSEPPPKSGSGEGPFYRMIEYALASVGLDNEVSAADLGRREAERRRAAPRSGGIRKQGRNSPTKPN
jgi:hypothetical protein